MRTDAELELCVRVAAGILRGEGLCDISEEEIREVCETGQTLVRESSRCAVWLDRQYAAYRRGEGTIKYIYISLAYIRGEVALSREMRMRGEKYPAELALQLRGAYRRMLERGTRIWLDKEDGTEYNIYG